MVAQHCDYDNAKHMTAHAVTDDQLVAPCNWPVKISLAVRVRNKHRMHLITIQPGISRLDLGMLGPWLSTSVSTSDGLLRREVHSHLPQ